MDNIKRFFLLMLPIVLLGITFRFIDYDKIPPAYETADEYAYPWTGMTLLQTGVPKSWSWFGAYPDGVIYQKWGGPFRIVSPWLDQQPLYSLISGSWMMLNGSRDLFDVRLSTLRVLPITLSFFTISLTGFLAKALFGNKVGLLSALLYATVPTIVIANRLSLTENLLTPISLLILWLFSLSEWKKLTVLKLYLVGLGCGLAIITKQVGMALPITILALLLIDRQWKNAIIIFFISIIFGLIYPLMGLYYDWRLFINLMKESRLAHSLGLPETIFTLFRFPGIGHKERIFLDGSILAGFLLLLTAPFWLKIQENYKKILPILIFPFIYLTLMVLIDGGQTWYGWYLFPLFPFLTILMGKAFFDLWQKPDFLKSLFFYLVLGSSTVRFLLLLLPNFQKSWQPILAVPLLILTGSFLLKTNYQRLILAVFFCNLFNR